MYRIILAIALIFNLLFARCQTVPDSIPRLNKTYFKSYLKDTKDIITTPFAWNKRQLVATLIAGGIGIMIYQNDGQIQSFSQDVRNTSSDAVSKYALEPWGRGLYTTSIVGLFYLHGILAKNDRTKKVALLGAKVLVVTAPFIFLSKALVYRDRPFYPNGPNPNKWHGLAYGLRNVKSIKDLDFNTSFPSGHTTSAFAIATIIASEYKDKPIVPIVAYSLATLTGLSRIHDNKHWASDVFAGALFGYGMAKVIYNRNNAGFQVLPYSTKKETGFFMKIPING